MSVIGIMKVDIYREKRGHRQNNDTDADADIYFFAITYGNANTLQL